MKYDFLNIKYLEVQLQNQLIVGTFIIITEVYYRAGISAEAYQKELEYQLRKTTIGISVGLVKEVDQHPPPEEIAPAKSRNRYFNPYSHFARNADDDKGVHQNFYNGKFDDETNGDSIHEYKICEIRPPSIEKVLKNSGFYKRIK